MAEPHSKNCSVCSGVGLVARAVAELAEGDHVRRSLQHLFGQEVCSKCGGTGREPLDLKTVQE